MGKYGNSSEPTVAAGVAVALLEFATNNGANRQILTDRSGVNPAVLQDPDGRVPLSRYQKLMQWGKQLTGDPALALHYGETFDLADVSIVGLIGRACENMASGLRQLNRYMPLIYELELDGTDRFVLTDAGGGFLWMVDRRARPNEFPELTESTMARIVCTSRRWFGEEQFIKEIHVTHAEPVYSSEYKRIFGVPVVFDAEKNAVLAHESWLTSKPGFPSQYVFGVLSDKADALLDSLENSKTFRGRVESLLMTVLHTGEANIDYISNEMALSRHTLFRRLKDEGVTFESILDELRHKLAVYYLRGGKTSVNETAYLVGFSDPAAFSRAFKRWTGVSPGTFRTRHNDPTGTSLPQ